MNGIGGTWRFDDDREGLARDLEALGAALARRGPEGGGSWQDGGTALVCRTFPVDRRGRREEQPLAGPDGTVLLWDGRLDNRDDLLAALPGLDAETPDAHLVLAAWRRWGEAFPERLLGDFALGLWDPRNGCLHLARDPGGLRPLFWRREPGRFLWASTLQALRAAGAPSRVDEEWIAGYFAFELEVERTPFAGLRAVPPGHRLRVDRGGERTFLFRRLEPQPLLRYRDDAEYEEHFRELFARVVGDRLRSAFPVAAELSGGVDSSSIACQAHELITTGACEAPSLVTLSYVFDESRTADERPFIERVENRIGRPGIHVVQERHPPFLDLHLPFQETPAPTHCNRARMEEAARRLREAGCRVVLSGLGGDEALRSEEPRPLEVADAVATGRWGRIRPALRQAAARTGDPFPRLLWGGLVVPFLPAPLRDRWSLSSPAAPPWMDAGFVRRTGLGRRFLSSSRGLDFPLPSQRSHYQDMVNALRLSAWRYDPGPVALELAQPYLDLRLLELCLSLPMDQLIRGRVSRSLLRRALEPILPTAIVLRRGKRALDEALLRGLSANWPQVAPLFDEPRVAALGWVDPDAFRRALREARYGRTRDTVALLQVVGLEAWLRSLEEPVAATGAAAAGSAGERAAG